MTITDSVEEVILHEGAHILDKCFTRCYLTDSNNINNCWILEGISTYSHSLQKKDGKFVIGEKKDVWELTGPTKYYELDKFCNFNRTQWDQEIRNGGSFNIVYCQTSALFRYFIQAENGKYKDMFIREAIIGRKCSSKDLAKILGVNSINDIEDKFIEFANNLYVKKISK